MVWVQKHKWFSMVGREYPVFIPLSLHQWSWPMFSILYSGTLWLNINNKLYWYSYKCNEYQVTNWCLFKYNAFNKIGRNDIESISRTSSCQTTFWFDVISLAWSQIFWFLTLVIFPQEKRINWLLRASNNYMTWRNLFAW